MKKLWTIVTIVAFVAMAGFALAGKPVNGTLTGTVKDAATGTAISGATVTTGGTSATTNSSGVYTMTIAAGTYTVTASATGYNSASQSATVTARNTTTANFSLTKPTSNGTLTGTVKDAATSATISGATVTAGGTTATTNSSGVYTMTIAAGTYTVTASATGYTSASNSATVNSGATTTDNFSLSKPVSGTYKIMAWNDLGMHCACPTFEGFLLLPPFNTLKAQVFKIGPTVITSSNIGTMTVNYDLGPDNTDANLQADPYYAGWITYSPKLIPGFAPVVGGKVKGITGNGISGTMAYDSNLLGFTATGIPAYPIVSADTTKNIMTDPLGGANRNPFPIATVSLKDSTGAVLASTTTVVPVAFGGCCSCHLTLASQNGYPATPAGSFAYLGKMHGQNTSKIDFSYIDPDGDGIGGPIRCSWCHWDPAMGENAAPGLPAVWPNYKILPGATFTSADIKVSQYSFSDVLHRFHTQDTKVLTQFDANIAVNCYDCHPGNNVNCYRGAHKGKTTIWCVDCHGNLNQRVAAGQLTQPWKISTLPSCNGPASGITSAFACHATTVTGGTTYPATPALFGKFINSRGHYGSPQCQTCHGEPHAEAPSTMALDNVQLSNLQGSASYSFPTGKDKTYALGVCNVCHSSQSNTWAVVPHH